LASRTKRNLGYFYYSRKGIVALNYNSTAERFSNVSLLFYMYTHFQNDKDREYELKKAFEKVRSIHNDHTLLIGPFIVIIGPNLWDISSAYVCIDAKIRFELPSCATAVQFCVKFMKCFNKKYSSICNHVWESIEITLFNFKYDHPSCAVSDVIKKINPQKTQLTRSKESTDVRTEMMENVQ